MKLNTTRPFNFTLLYIGWKDTITGGGTGVSRNYLPATKHKADVVVNAVGELIVYTDAEFQNDGWISGVTTTTIKNGVPQLLYKGGTPAGPIWQIILSQSIADAYGNKDKYRYHCRMILPSRGSIVTEVPGEVQF